MEGCNTHPERASLSDMLRPVTLQLPGCSTEALMSSILTSEMHCGTHSRSVLCWGTRILGGGEKLAEAT